MTEPSANDLEKLRLALAGLEAQRGILGEAVEPALLLVHGQQVGQRLTGVLPVGEGVMTGTRACCVSSSTVRWEKVRAVMASTKENSWAMPGYPAATSVKTSRQRP
jgi:hypothetical protein